MQGSVEGNRRRVKEREDGMEGGVERLVGRKRKGGMHRGRKDRQGYDKE